MILRPCPNPWCNHVRMPELERDCRPARGRFGAVDRRAVVCPWCGLEGPSAENDKEAGEAWNDRAGRAGAEIADLEKVLENSKVIVKEAVMTNDADKLLIYTGHVKALLHAIELHAHNKAMALLGVQKGRTDDL